MMSGCERIAKERLYNVHDANGKRMYIGMAYDSQCKMYYWPESNGFITDDQVKYEHWDIIEAGYYEL
jgi:hypothetical protein